MPGCCITKLNQVSQSKHHRELSHDIERSINLIFCREKDKIAERPEERAVD